MSTRLGTHASAPRYLVAVLAAVFVFNAADRYALAALIQPIQQDLALSDGDAGILIGLAFAISYCLFAVPLGRLVDRASRIAVLVACLIAWSLATAAFGLTSQYWHLLLARIGVAAGEAGAYSAVQSLIGDYYAASRRSSAMAWMQFGSLLGMIGGLGVAGWLSDWLGWRGAFVVLGLAGLPLAVVLWTSVAEPQRGAADGLRLIRRPLGLAMTLRELLGRRAYRLVLLGIALASIAMYGIAAWLPAFLTRTFALSVSHAGLLASVLVPVPMMLGTLVCSLCSDALYRRNPSWAVWLPSMCVAAAVPCVLVMISGVGAPATYAAIAAFSFLCGMHNIPLLSLCMTLSGATMRGTSAALVALLLIMVGNGLGPAAIGLASDLFKAQHSVLAQPLGAAIALAVLPLMFALVPLLGAARQLELGIDEANAFDGSLAAASAGPVRA